MRELVYYVAISLDGRIAGPKGEFDFFFAPLADEERSAAYNAWVDTHYPEVTPTVVRAAAGLTDVPNVRFDTVILGLGSYRPAYDAGIESPYAHLRQYVVSSTLGEVADPDVTVVDRDPLGLIRALKKEGGDKDIWLCGGGRLAGELMPEIDRLVLKTYPVLAGAGVPLIDGGFDPAFFTVVDRQIFDNGVTVTELARS
ncbi:dihydrofolate reductase family protein [Nocardia sp. NBC_00508]|uniref:dihydrofolate reductase family protein n=1 Tax=Nocardia sp. NBC_00508 TaxID=2975992 RepID=UPI002E81FEE7|nr:dihydrofolate reductase family protein [Nocardia sp. NBC_00508]WUD63686.1 dihydrofolate reductase family protein [Nocardia sp. NBC_00508]